MARRRWVVRSRSSNGGSWASHSRARPLATSLREAPFGRASLACARRIDLVVRRPFALLGLFPLRSNRLVPQKLPLLAPSGAVRGLRWLLVRVPLLRTICGRSARRGRRGRLASPKPSAATPSQTSLLRDCRARFSASGGRRPRSNEVGTTSRTTNRPRGLRLFSRRLGLNEDAAGTLRAGRENPTPVLWGRVGMLTVARVDDGRGAVGV